MSEETNERYRGQRLGYLDYHTEVLKDRLDELDVELNQIRQQHSGKEQKTKERSALLKFRQDMKNRIEKIDYQIQGVKKHEHDDALSVAKRQKESSYSVHQEDADDIDTNEDGFTTASEL
jgi:hypothetical protein